MMSLTKQKKRSKSESLVESGASIETDSAPKKKQKKDAKNVEEKTSKVNGSSEATTQLTTSQRKRLKSKQRKLKAIEKIKAEGGTPKSLWSAKKEHQAAKAAEKSTKGKTKVEKKSGDTVKAKEKRAEKTKSRKQKRLSEGQYKIDQIILSPDEIRLRIEEIKGRAELTKTARRKLAVLKKKLAVLEGVALQSDKKGDTEKKSDNKGLSKAEKRRLRREKGAPDAEGTEAGEPDVEKPVNIHTFEKKKAKLNKAQPSKGEVEGADKKKNKEKKQGAIVLQVSKPGNKIVKKTKLVSESVEDEDEDDDEEEAESESASEDETAEVEEGEDSEDDDDDDEEEDDEEEEEEEEEDSDEEEETQSNGLNSSLNQFKEKDAGEEEEEEEEEEDEDEEEEEDEDEDDHPSKKKATNASKPEGKQKKEQQTNLKKQQGQEANGDKKKRYVLFVGNIPFDLKPADLEKHFLTKVGEVSSVRIPTKKGTQIPRGFAYVEVTNNIDYEKGLSLHHSMVNGRRINVEYTLAGSKQVVKRQELVSKNQKLHAMRKAGQLAGSQKHDQKRSVRRFKKKEQERKPN
ncbi:nucleolin [Neodiprion pinetum]|uniref:nucleolin n=1 Tax=Neodiprion pinetum TaxID=441929 RepID=UPI001EE02208|nr:glutamic acid-rich protein-like [Neodiprion pinetum]